MLDLSDPRCVQLDLQVPSRIRTDAALASTWAVAVLLAICAGCPSGGGSDDVSTLPPPDCADGAPCPANAPCVDGYCFSDGIRCGDDAGLCGVLYECVDDFCGGRTASACQKPDAAECCSVFDCGGYETCSNFSCLPPACSSNSDCKVFFGFTGSPCAAVDDCTDDPLSAEAGCLDISPPQCVELVGTCCDSNNPDCVIDIGVAADGGAVALCTYPGQCADGFCDWRAPPPPGGVLF